MAGVVVCAATWLGALVVPFYSGSSVSSSTRSSDGTLSSSIVQGTHHETLVQANGTRILIVLSIPLVIALVGLLGARGIIPRVGLVAAVVLIWLWTVITGFSVGLFYIPAAIALTVAVIASPQTPRATRPRVANGA